MAERGIIKAFTIIKDCNIDLAGPGGTKQECGWEQLLILADQTILFCIYLSAVLGTLSVAYAGWLMISAGGNSGQIDKAKKIFGKVVWGIIIVLVAYLLVQTVLKLIGLEEAYNLLETR